jgi:hypothetical protein
LRGRHLGDKFFWQIILIIFQEIHYATTTEIRLTSQAS